MSDFLEVFRVFTIFLVNSPYFYSNCFCVLRQLSEYFSHISGFLEYSIATPSIFYVNFPYTSRLFAFSVVVLGEFLAYFGSTVRILQLHPYFAFSGVFLREFLAYFGPTVRILHPYFAFSGVFF